MLTRIEIRGNVSLEIKRIGNATEIAYDDAVESVRTVTNSVGSSGWSEIEKILNAIKIVYDEAFEKLVAFTKSVCSEMEKILNAVIVSLDSIMEFLQKSRVRGIWSLFPM